MIYSSRRVITDAAEPEPDSQPDRNVGSVECAVGVQEFFYCVFDLKRADKVDLGSSRNVARVNPQNAGRVASL